MTQASEREVPLGRKPRTIPRIGKRVYIRQDIMATVDLILLDPMREKVKYGKWSDLLEALLRNWVAEQRSGNLRFTLSPAEMQKIKALQQTLDHTPIENPTIAAAAFAVAKRTLKEVFG